jgi:uncharacterized repeat protein (TIGR03806 family)
VKKLLALLTLLALTACSDSNDTYVPLPVSVDLASVPYQKLSDYHFFTGEMSLLEPADGLVPFKPTSELFSDYAHKQRYLWLPAGVNATYVSDDEVLNLPVGAALIKNFFYENTQPSGQRRIVETRLMIHKATGWIFATYVWNDAQTEAILDMNGSTTTITWTDNNGAHTIDYEIPSENNCITCHSVNDDNLPIGIKPRNLNSDYTYLDGAMNQLTKLESIGYVQDLPSLVASVVDYNNTSQPLDLRVRSYFDINCAHCHRDGGSADYVNPRFSFELTTDPANMGVCVGAQLAPPGIPHGKVVSPGDISQSVLHYTMTTNNSNFKMPRLGRTVVHTEAVALVGQWINSLPECE